MALKKLEQRCKKCGCSLFIETLRDGCQYHSYTPSGHCKGCYKEMLDNHYPVMRGKYRNTHSVGKTV